MYHSNPASIKASLATMPDADLLRHVTYIRKQVNSLPEGNKHDMFINLYTWAYHHCRVCRPALLPQFFDLQEKK